MRKGEKEKAKEQSINLPERIEKPLKIASAGESRLSSGAFPPFLLVRYPEGKIGQGEENNVGIVLARRMLVRVSLACM